MVMEHVPDAARAWSNMFALLAPGGVALAFHPTLYAPAFVINWLAPEALTGPVLRFFFPGARARGYPQSFRPATICAPPRRPWSNPFCAAPVSVKFLSAPFWGDLYFEQLPGLREGNDALSALAESRDWRRLASHAYTIALK